MTSSREHAAPGCGVASNGGTELPDAPVSGGAPVSGPPGSRPAVAPVSDAGTLPNGVPASTRPGSPVDPVSPAPSRPVSGAGAPTNGVPAPSRPVSGAGYRPGIHPEYSSRLPAVPGPGNRSRQLRNLLPVVGLCLLVVGLVTAVVGQAVVLHRTGERVTALERDVATGAVQARDADREIAELQKRSAVLDARTRGSINSAAVAKRVLPSVFRVRAGSATGSAFAFGVRPPAGGTSLITNFHVVRSVVDAGGSTVSIQRGTTSYRARVVRTDRGRDLALLETTERFPVLGAASTTVQPGSPVVVVGSPLGLADSVTTGVVSAIRPWTDGRPGQFIQFDAAISPGNSGGPLVDADGRVVGVAQSKLVQEGVEGISMAIPIAAACDGFVAC
jgi:putative serine protease PepD